MKLFHVGRSQWAPAEASTNRFVILGICSVAFACRIELGGTGKSTVSSQAKHQIKL